MFKSRQYIFISRSLPITKQHKVILLIYYNSANKPYKAAIYKEKTRNGAQGYLLLDKDMMLESQGTHNFCRIRVNNNRESMLKMPYVQAQLVLIKVPTSSSLQLCALGCKELCGIYEEVVKCK